MGVGTTLALPTCQCAPWLCTRLRMGSSPLSLPAPLPETPDLCPVTQLGFLRFGDCDYGARVDTGVGPRPVLCVGVCLGKLVPPPWVGGFSDLLARGGCGAFEEGQWRAREPQGSSERLSHTHLGD